MPPELARIFASFPTEEDELREMVEQIAPFYVHRADPALAVEHFSSVIPDADATRRGFEILATWSSIDRLGTVTCPTVVIAGRFDVVTPWPHALRITAHLTDAHAVIFEESGHIPWIDEPEMFFDTLGAWLDRFAIGRTRSAVAS